MTRNSCGENATIVVSIAVHYLLGDIAGELCSNTPVFCDKPPLPADESTIDNEIDIHNPVDNELDKDKLDKIYNETDNAIDVSKGAVTTLYTSMMPVLPYIFSILFTYAL